MTGRIRKLGLGAVQIQQFGAPSDVLIRVEQQPVVVEHDPGALSHGG